MPPRIGEEGIFLLCVREAVFENSRLDFLLFIFDRRRIFASPFSYPCLEVTEIRLFQGLVSPSVIYIK